ncbi:MAG: thioredoxin family protein [Rhodospirillales bacterium]|jgi:peroxiredoxin|nr:thioredoxin family protein [Rhodospirillales bacterium]
MPLTQAGTCDFGWKAVDFTLPATDGKTYTLADVSGPKGIMIAFICNHCPYVKAIHDRLVCDANDLAAIGVGFAAIMCNHPHNYPEDTFEKMVEVAKAEGYTFPYLYDESQEVAKAYGAVCTPDFFGFNADRELQYRGRIDEAGQDPIRPGARRELFEAMKLVAETGKGPEAQTVSIGCSIEWLEDVA